MPLTRIVSLIFIVATLFSCRREPTTWNTSIAGPVASGRLTLEDLVPDSLLYVDGTGLYHLLINESLTDLDIDSLVSLPDTTVHHGFVVPDGIGTISLGPGQVLFSQEIGNDFDLPGAELKEVIIKSGYLSYEIKNYANAFLESTYTFTGASLNGQTLVLNETTSPGTDAAPDIKSGLIDISGYHIDLTGESGFDVNNAAGQVLVKVSPLQPGSALISELDSVAIDLHFIDPVISYARGYFGQHSFGVSETASLTGSLDMPDGSIDIEEVTVRFRIENYVGADARVDLEAINALDTNGQDVLALDNVLLFQPINVTRAYMSGNTVIPVIEEITLDNGNSNADEFIESLPPEIFLQGEVEINPLGDVSDGNDFISTDNALSAGLEIDIPLCVGMSGLTVRDTIGIADEIPMTASGMLIIRAGNAFPFAANMDIQIVHEGEILHEIAGDIIVPAGASGLPVAASESENIIAIAPSVWDLFNPENDIVITAVFDTPSGGIVKLYPSHYIDIVLIADGITEVEIK